MNSVDEQDIFIYVYMFKVNMLFLTFNILCIEESKSVNIFSPTWMVSFAFPAGQQSQECQGENVCLCV